LPPAAHHAHESPLLLPLKELASLKQVGDEGTLQIGMGDGKLSQELIRVGPIGLHRHQFLTHQTLA
jgi:hypothetical protein